MYNQLYADSQRRVAGLVAPLSADQLALVTPACPRWTVRDVLAHLAGESTFFTGDSTDPVEQAARPGSEPWTAAQVGARQHQSVADLVAEWESRVPAIQEIPLTSRSWFPMLHDVLSHEADIRGAIGAPRIAPDIVAAAWPLLAPALERQLAPLGTVQLELDEQPSLIGSGDPDLVVETSQYDFWRGYFGRRSVGQLRRWVRRGDAEAFAAALPVFTPRPDDMVEAG
jgi:uncharacterized protein (TIGR03083 family)